MSGARNFSIPEGTRCKNGQNMFNKLPSQAISSQPAITTIKLLFKLKSLSNKRK
jgi:hypothetical protein